MQYSCSICLESKEEIEFKPASGIGSAGRARPVHAYCNPCMVTYTKNQGRTRNIKRRLEACQVVGIVCAKCGLEEWKFGEKILPFSRIVHFDHIEGDGDTHRGPRSAKEKISNSKNSAKIILNMHPDDARKMFQPLCPNCHQAKTLLEKDYLTSDSAL